MYYNLNRLSFAFKNNYHIFLIIFSLLVIPTINAQHIPSDERSDPNFRAQNQLESNNVRTTVFN